MNRRELISLLVGAGIALPARMEAQQSQYVPTIGFLHPGSPEAGSPVFDALQEGLRDVGCNSRWRPEFGSGRHPVRFCASCNRTGIPLFRGALVVRPSDRTSRPVSEPNNPDSLRLGLLLGAAGTPIPALHLEA